jgi:hypothetical protein
MICYIVFWRTTFTCVVLYSRLPTIIAVVRGVLLGVVRDVISWWGRRAGLAV